MFKCVSLKRFACIQLGDVFSLPGFHLVLFQLVVVFPGFPLDLPGSSHEREAGHHHNPARPDAGG